MSGRLDSNQRPPEPHSGALAKLRHAPSVKLNHTVVYDLHAIFIVQKEHGFSTRIPDFPLPFPDSVRLVLQHVARVVSGLGLAWWVPLAIWRLGFTHPRRLPDDSEHLITPGVEPGPHLCCRVCRRERGYVHVDIEAPVQDRVEIGVWPILLGTDGCSPGRQLETEFVGLLRFLSGEVPQLACIS